MGRSKQLATIIESAPSTLDTLNELAAALGDDANFSTTVTNSIATKSPLADPNFTGDVDIQTTAGKLTVEALGGGSVKLTSNGSLGFNVPTGYNYEIDVNDQEVFRINQSGNVGIGTTDPRGKLQIGSGIGGSNVPSSHELVFGANNSDITFLSDSSGTSVDGTIGAWNTVYNFQNSKIEFDKPAANLGQLLFYTNTGSGITERMRIQHDGKVGIGTTSPGDYYAKDLVVGAADEGGITIVN